MNNLPTSATAETEFARGPLFPPLYHRPGLRYIEGGAEGAAAGAEGAGAAADDGKQGKTFTQAELDQIVQERVARERAKYTDYDDLKAKAGQAKTLEERLGTVETELSTTRAAALRAQIAAEFGISTKKGPKGEPSDAEVLLTGTDEASLTAQATRIAGVEADRKKSGNVAPKEGGTKQTGNGGDSDLREFTRNLFAGANAE